VLCCWWSFGGLGGASLLGLCPLRYHFVVIAYFCFHLRFLYIRYSRYIHTLLHDLVMCSWINMGHMQHASWYMT